MMMQGMVSIFRKPHLFKYTAFSALAVVVSHDVICVKKVAEKFAVSNKTCNFAAKS